MPALVIYFQGRFMRRGIRYLKTSVITAGAFPAEPLLPDVLRAPFLRHHGLVPFAADDAEAA